MPTPVIPPDDPGDHGKGPVAGGACCDATNTLLETISDTLTELNSEAETCCTDTQDILNDILVALGGSSGALERHVDGDIQVGVGTITIPDGVISYSVSVLAGGSDVTDLSTWVTIDGPDFTAALPLRDGQSVNEGADGSNVLLGPFTVTVPANGAANATWVFP